MSWISIAPRDPIIARDGRPFSTTQRRMRSLDWPYPSVLAGSLRTLLGKLADVEFTAKASDLLRQIEVAGPLPTLGNELYFPAPSDIVVQEDEAGHRKWFAARPRHGEWGGCDLPRGTRNVALLPAILRADIEDFKPAKIPAFWSHARMTEWLSEDLSNFPAPPAPHEVRAGRGFLPAPAQDRRTHVFIEAATGAAKDSRLYQTTGLDFTSLDFANGVRMVARAESAGKDLAALLDSLDVLHPFGGERRLAHWTVGSNASWDAPAEVLKALKDARQIRLVLATPAVFANGWLPGWLDADLRCSRSGVTMRLVGATMQRWRPISGWSLESSEQGKPGPKKVKRAVPAGGVYFFQVEDGDPSELARLFWLRAVSDEPQDQRDGFGLALWGPWCEI